MPTPIIVGLGSNHDARRKLPQALLALAGHCRPLAVAPVYETVARDKHTGALLVNEPCFLNSAVLIETPIDPVTLVTTVLRPLEVSLGRSRTKTATGIIPIDLDLLYYGDTMMAYPHAHVIVPAPEAITRIYSALPAADVAPDFRHPVTGHTLKTIAGRLCAQGGLAVSTLDLQPAIAAYRATPL